MRADNAEANEILDLYFPVLDHGFVALVDYMGDDAAIVDAARTSYGAGTKRVSEDRALTRYLYRHRHTTPLEMVELKFHCKMPIFVARQWIRHRTASVNEYSGRYSLMPMQFYTPKREQVATQDDKNRQGRSDNLLSAAEYELFVAELQEQRALAADNYIDFVRVHKVAREVARIDLPLSMYTEWYWKIDAHNLTHFLGLRCDSHAQWEVRQYAYLIAAMLQRVCPDLFEAWLDYHPNMGGVLFSSQEVYMLRRMLQTYEASDTERLVSPPEAAPLSPADMKDAGMSQREVDAFMKLFRRSDQKRKVPAFDIDVSKGKPASHFAAEAKKYTLKID